MKSVMTSMHRTVGAVLAAGLLSMVSAGAALASPLNQAIAVAEQQFGGQAFDAEFFRENGQRRAEVELLSGSEIVEVLFDADTGAILDVDTYGNQRRIDRAAAALSLAKISLLDATGIARKAVGRGQILEAELRVTANPNANGKRYIVDVRNKQGEFEVIINSRTGKVIRVIRD